jgi:NAD(P)-dependent dehydrogenase (short-subunit alcohol dehydrogenase family)
MERLKGKRMVITGSSRSLGREFALACAREGASLVVNGTNADALAATEDSVRALGAPVVSVAGSVAEESVATALVESCREAFGGIDVMVCNAGIVRDRTLLKMTAEEFDEVIAVDLRGPFLCMQQAARAMVEQETGGQVIHITSASGLIGNFGQTNYAAAKAGLIGMTYTAMKELGKKGVRANAMWPVARTDMTQPLIDRVGKSARELGFGEATDVAQGLVLLASDACAHWSGQCLTFNGYRTALWQSPTEQHVLEANGPISLEQLEDHYAGVTPLEIYSRQPSRDW